MQQLVPYESSDQLKMTNRPGSSKSQITLGIKKNVTNNMFLLKNKNHCACKNVKKKIYISEYVFINFSNSRYKFSTEGCDLTAKTWLVWLTAIVVNIELNTVYILRKTNVTNNFLRAKA